MDCAVFQGYTLPTKEAKLWTLFNLTTDFFLVFIICLFYTLLKRRIEIVNRNKAKVKSPSIYILPCGNSLNMPKLASVIFDQPSFKSIKTSRNFNFRSD